MGSSFFVEPILCKNAGPFWVPKLHLKGITSCKHSFIKSHRFFVFFNFGFLGHFFCANLTPKTDTILVNNLSILGVHFVLFFEGSFELFWHFLGGFFGFLTLSWEASGSKNHEKLRVF